jgi:hypothetical protein
MAGSSEAELAHPRLLSAIDEEPWATGCCSFVDPVADLAVLGGTQDDETFGGAAEYVRPLRVARIGPANTEMPVRLFGLDGKWIEATAHAHGAAFSLTGLGTDNFRHSRLAGLSGSPILDVRGRAVAVFVISSNREPHGPQPALEWSLPAGLWRELYGRRRPLSLQPR